MLKPLAVLLGCGVLLSACTEDTESEPPGPTPRELLFDVSLPSHVRLSPGGQWVSFAQNFQGVPNLWLKPVREDAPPRPLTQFEYPGVQSHVWHPTGKYLLFLRQTPGADDVRPYVYDLEDKKVRALFGAVGQQARFLAFSDRNEDDVYFLSNARQPERFDIYRADLKTGANLLVYSDELGAAGYFAGPDLDPLIAQVSQPDGGFQWRMRTKDGAWRLWGAISPQDALTTRIDNISRNGQHVYVVNSVGRNTAALLDMPIDGVFEPKRAKLLAAQNSYDFLRATYHPILQTPVVAEFATPLPSWVPLSNALTSQVFGMRASGSGQLRIVDAARSSKRWAIAHESTSQPAKWGVFDADKAEKIDLFTAQDALMAQQAAIQTLPVKLALSGGERDGYLTIPLGYVLNAEGGLDKPLPTVIALRGGLVTQDRWAYRPVHQWLASRGVAVLSFNHLGSSGQGKDHLLEASAQATVRDIADAAAWLKQKTIAGDQMGVVASGYGARMALQWAQQGANTLDCMALAHTALDISAVAGSLPPQLAGLAKVVSALPGGALGQPAAPPKEIALFLAHGERNRRQPYDEVAAWAELVRQHGNPVTLVAVKRAQSRFDAGSDARAVMAAMEAFLAPCLGFEAEPITIEDFKNADIRLDMAPDDIAQQVRMAMQTPSLSR